MSAYGIPTTPSEVWAQLKDPVYHLVKHPDKGFDATRYMEIYTLVYNHCTSKSAAGYGAGAGAGGASGTANVQGRDLYSQLRELLQKRMGELLAESKGLIDVDLLVYYVREWRKFTEAAKYLDHLFTYLNRHWVKRKIDDNYEGVYRIHTMCLVMWRDHLFAQLSEPLCKALLAQIELERNGETIDRSMIKSVLDSYISLDLPANEAGGSASSSMDNLPAGTSAAAASLRNDAVYRKHFENHFFTATEAFYKAESSAFLAANSVTEYMKKAERRLTEEAERVKWYLHESTLASLVALCELKLILDHEVTLRDEFGSLLAGDRDEDMARMFRLVSRRADRLEPLRIKLEGHVRQMGLDAILAVVENAAKSAEAGAGGDDDEDAGGDDAGASKGAANGAAATSSADVPIEPKAYVDALLAVHGKYAALVATAFANDPGFVGSLDKACREFVNRNAVCVKSAKRSPELLAKYCDQLLKKSAKNPEEAELDALLTQIMVVFKYLEDRDVFQHFYSKGLARRLIGQISASDDAEESMINKLKEACGSEYTSKLQRMFLDVGTSRDMTAEFATKIKENNVDGVVDLNVMVLNHNSWPTSQQTTEFALPAELLRTYERFTHFYNSKHSGRKLSWDFKQSRGELRGHFPKAKVVYQLSMSVYQMGVMLQYNTGDVFSYEELHEATKLSREYLVAILSLLVRGKMVLMQPADGAVGAPGSKYALNLDYKNKKTRMNFALKLKAEEKQETDETLKAVEEDRMYVIKAAVVRTMKMRKVLKHQMLVQEVIGQLQSRFQPRIPDIKKAIDALIEQEYMERKEGEKDMYSYIA